MAGKKINFTKMEGLGNDYIYVDCRKQTISSPAKLARAMADRHFGIGSDGLILIKDSTKADFKMQIFNADGSEAEMCGNGLRCVAKFVYDKKHTKKKELEIETGAGILKVNLFLKANAVHEVEVDMGEPILARESIPVLGEGEQCVDEEMQLEDGVRFNVTCVSMGNPHAVIFTEAVEEFPLSKYGPFLENHNQFPNRSNVEFVEKISEGKLRQRTWERGSGETMACGTGACAVVVAGVINKISSRKTEVVLNGGSLFIHWDEKTNHVFMRGPATEVFNGTYITR